MEDGDQVTVGQCRPLSKTVRVMFRNRVGEMSLTRESGSIQCSTCAPPDWKGCEGFRKILDVRR